jgi:hypothetical protein
MQQAVDYHIKSLNDKSICEWAKSYSRMVWHRIHYLRTIPRLKIFETTITQNLIFDLCAKKFGNISIFESIDENANGDDIEIVRKIDGKYYTYCIQSKIAYKNESYSAIDHSVEDSLAREKVLQIDLLLNYASINDYIPLYFLYSFKRDGNRSNEDYGIAVTSAEYVKTNWIRNGCFIRKPAVDDIVPNGSISFSQFLCNRSILSFIEDNGEIDIELFRKRIFPYIEQIDKFRTFQREEVFNNEKWITIPKKMMTDIALRQNKKEINSFAPKYRFVIE